MKLEINKELKDLIPPLQKDEYKLLEDGLLGFESDCKMLKIIPSDIGPMWFHARYIDDNIMTEHYTKRPMAFSRLSSIMPYYDLLRTKKLTPLKMKPQPLDFNDRNGENKKFYKTNVYLIQSVIGGPVKIGKANNVWERLKQHQCGSPFILEIIKIYKNVDPKFERDLHDKFTEYRIHGEWFDEKILTLIK